MTTPPEKTITAMPATPVVPADPWPEQNRRRLSLLRKRRESGLDAAEQAEFDRLNKLADAVVDASIRPLLLSPEQWAYVQSKVAE